MQECHRAMIEASAAAGWAHGALHRVACGREPPCRFCAHDAAQRTCAMQLEVGVEAAPEALQPKDPGRVAWCNVSNGFKIAPQPAPVPGGDCAFRGVATEPT